MNNLHRKKEVARSYKLQPRPSQFSVSRQFCEYLSQQGWGVEEIAL